MIVAVFVGLSALGYTVDGAGKVAGTFFWPFGLTTDQWSSRLNAGASEASLGFAVFVTMIIVFMVAYAYVKSRS